MRKAFFRVDAIAQIGFGHLFRMLRMASFMKKEGWSCEFISVYSNRQADLLIQGSGCVHHKVKSLEEEYDLLSKKGNTLDTPIFVDVRNGMTFSDKHTYQTSIDSYKSCGLITVCLEDLNANSTCADFIVIPYVGANALKHIQHQGTTYLLGPRYFILDESFGNYEPVIKPANKVSRILVTMGGSDPWNYTGVIARCLNDIDLTGIHIRFILGPSSSLYPDQLEEMLVDFSGTWSYISSVKDMASELSQADIVITNSGLTRYEIAALGIPCLGIANDESHHRLSLDFAETGAMRYMGIGTELSTTKLKANLSEMLDNYELRKSMSQSASDLLDAEGAKHILTAIQLLQPK